MTVAQEGIGITKIKIYSVLLQKFGVPETKFCSFPPVLQSSDQVPSFIIPLHFVEQNVGVQGLQLEAGEAAWTVKCRGVPLAYTKIWEECSFVSVFLFIP